MFRTRRTPVSTKTPRTISADRGCKQLICRGFSTRNSVFSHKRTIGGCVFRAQKERLGDLTAGDSQLYKRLYPLGIIISVIVASTTVQAQSTGDRVFMTGARLLALCKSDNPYCTGYIAGVADTLAPLSELGGPIPSNSLASFCPRQMNLGQAILAFQKFAQSNPEGLQINAAQFVGDALHASFPCLRKSN